VKQTGKQEQYSLSQFAGSASAGQVTGPAPLQILRFELHPRAAQGA
jgi:hypothetical protein